MRLSDFRFGYADLHYVPIQVSGLAPPISTTFRFRFGSADLASLIQIGHNSEDVDKKCCNNF